MRTERVPLEKTHHPQGTSVMPSLREQALQEGSGWKMGTTRQVATPSPETHNLLQAWVPTAQEARDSVRTMEGG